MFIITNLYFSIRKKTYYHIENQADLISLKKVFFIYSIRTINKTSLRP